MRIIDRIHQLLAQDEGSFHLEGEGIKQPIVAPKSEVVARELARLRSSGPSFLALVAPNGNYLQAAGNAKRMTIEAHVIAPQRTVQVVLGRVPWYSHDDGLIVRGDRGQRIRGVVCLWGN